MSAGEYVGPGSNYDRVADPEDDGVDVIAFADFMRATKAPSRGTITTNVRLRAGFLARRLRELPCAIDRHRPARQPIPEFAGTARQIKTAQLWALRTRNRLMHDGLSSTKEEAIQRHGGQAATVTAAFTALSAGDQALLLEFLDSL